MKTDGYYHRAHDRLPIELWGTILRAATEFSGQFDTSWVSPLDNPTAFLTPKSLIPNWDVKCTIVTVCKIWRALCIPFKFETIVIGDRDQIPLLFATLSSPALFSKLIPVGRYVRRFDAIMDRTKTPQFCFDLAGIDRIWEFVPNIKVLTVDLRGDGGIVADYVELLENLLKTPHNALRSISIYSQAISRSPNDIYSLLMGLPHELEHLALVAINRNVIHPSTPYTTPPMFGFPHLHTLNISRWLLENIGHEVARWSLPSLSFMSDDSVINISDVARKPVGYKTFLHAHGDHITTLSHLESEWSSPVSTTISFVPSLHDWTYRLHAVPTSTIPVPCVRIGLARTDDADPKCLVEQYTQFMDREKYPNLAVVRNVSHSWLSLSGGAYGLAEVEKVKEFWKEWTARFLTRKVRLEDAKGRLMCDAAVKSV